MTFFLLVKFFFLVFMHMLNFIFFPATRAGLLFVFFFLPRGGGAGRLDRGNLVSLASSLAGQAG